MPISVHQTIPCDARCSLLSYRAELEGQHGIRMNFPKVLVRGSNQEMVLTGGPNAIRKAQEDIKMIMCMWREEFEGYRERQRVRREDERRLKASSRSLPKVGVLKKKKGKSSTNGFACLFVEEEKEKKEVKDMKEESVLKLPAVVKPNGPVLTGWAAIAAKPAVESIAKGSVVVAPPMTSPKKATKSSYYEEEKIDEEEDRSSGWFDWGEAAMN